jgi:hypothetical protein
MRMRRVRRFSTGRGGPVLAVLLTTAAVAWLPLLPILALAMGLVAPGRSPAQGLAASDSDLVYLARTYTAAWNAHDLAAVLACFAPDAVVRERQRHVPPDVWDTHDPQVVRTYLDDAHGGDTYDPGGLAWAMGPQQIAAWAAARFARHPRVAADPPRVAGDTVG